MADVFISYAREDKAFVHRLYEAFTREGREAWVDWKGIPPASEFPAEIQSGIEEANAFLFIISPYSIVSDWCRRELAHAVKHNKRLVPIQSSEIADETTVPETIRTLHWISARADDEFETALQSLIKAIDTDLEWVRAHTRLTVRAVEWDRKGRSRSYVLRGEDLQEAEEWLAQGATEDPRPTALQTQYIIASGQDATRRQRTTLGAVIAFCIVVGVAAAVAFYLNRVAEGERQVARTEAVGRVTAEAEEAAQRQIAQARRLGAESELLLDNQPNLLLRSTLLTVESLRRFPLLEGNQALYRTLSLLPRPMARMQHEDDVFATIFSPDGKWLATGSRDHTARVWDASTGQEVARMGHEDIVRTVAFSPDGRWVASGGDCPSFWESCQATVRVWKAMTGEEIARMVHEGTVWTVVFSPDGQWLATGSLDGTARLWEATTGKELARMEHEYPVWDVAFSPNGKWLATASGDYSTTPSLGEARIWEATTGREMARLVHERGVETVAFSPDGKWLATGGGDIRMEGGVGGSGEARVWEVSTEREIARLVHGGAVGDLAFSPDGRWLAVASDAGTVGTVRVWEVPADREVMQVAFEHSVRDMAFSSDGRWLAAGSADNSARVWEVATWREVARVVHDSPDWGVYSVAFTPDGQWLATGGGGSTARVWEMGIGYELVEITHEYPVYTVSFSPDGKWLATGRLWETATGHEATWMSEENHVWSIAFSPDGQWLATEGAVYLVRVWEVASRQEVSHRVHEGEVTAVTFSSDGRWVATGSNKALGSSEVLVWEAGTGRVVARMAHASRVEAVAFSPNGQWVVAGTSDGIAPVWEATTGKQVAQLAHNGDTIWEVVFSLDSKLLVTKDLSTVRVWDTDTWQEVAKITHMGINAIAFSPNSRWLATTGSMNSAGTQGAVWVWEASTRQEIAQMIHEGLVMDAVFSIDGKWLGTASGDRTARVWETESWREVSRIAHQERVSCIAFSPDGKWLATGSLDGTVRVLLWQTEDLITEACARLTRNLTYEEWEQYFGSEPYRRTCPNLP